MATGPDLGITTASLNDSMNTTTPEPDSEPGVNVWGLVGVIVFYLLILVVGLVASWRNKSLRSQQSEQVMLAGRNIGLFVGVFTMTATWVGGGYINGTAEAVYSYGLVWAQAPVGYSLSLILGGAVFAKKMRSEGYVTMLDPFERKYGAVVAGLLYIPALLGELFWSAAILSALGASLAVILHLNHNVAIIISAAVAIFYTVIGGLFSVAFTDVIQLICIFIGLWLGVGFALTNDAVLPLGITMSENPEWNTDTNDTWLGYLPADYGLGVYIDSALLLICGGIPWQVYFQRVLACRNARTAQITSFLAALGCLFMAIPAVLIGAIGRSADWSQTDYRGEIPLADGDVRKVLPLVLQYLTPPAVAVIGLGAVSAAVMSSADSSILSASSMLAHNIYKPIRAAAGRGKCPENEVLWVMRGGVIVVGILATVIAIVVESIYGLWYLCSDLVYVILFPQLLTVVHLPFTNTYGALSGYLMGWLFRLLGGEPLLHLPPVIYYPWWYESDGDIYQNFPFKTLCMLISLLFIVGVSALTNECMKRGWLPSTLMLSDSKEELGGEPGKGPEPIQGGTENAGFVQSTHF